MTKKQAVKAFMKSNNRLFAQRNGEKVMLCNGYYILTIDYVDYRLDFVPASGLFKDLSDGEKIVIANGETLPDTTDFNKLFDSAKDSVCPAIETPFLTDWNTPNNAVYRLFLSNDKALIYINNSYLETFKAFYEDKYLSWYTQPGKKGSVTGLVDFNNKLMILPIRVNCPYTVTFERLSV